MENIIAMYLKYVNDFITVEKFSEWYWIEIEDAEKIIEMWKKYNERILSFYK